MSTSNKSNKENNEKNESTFQDIINSYIKHLNSLAEVVPFVMELVVGKIKVESNHLDEFISEKGIRKNSDEEEDKNNDNNKSEKLLIPADDIKYFMDLNDKIEASSIAYKFLPINFIVSFVSQYDAYLGNLIRQIFITKPDILNSSEKSLQFSDLVTFKSIEEATESIIEKEIETVLRESHFNQFQWLEKKLNMKLRADLPNFPDFIEITERRNLFTHCNGIVDIPEQTDPLFRKNLTPHSGKLTPGSKTAILAF